MNMNLIAHLSTSAHLHTGDAIALSILIVFPLLAALIACKGRIK